MLQITTVMGVVVFEESSFLLRSAMDLYNLFLTKLKNTSDQLRVTLKT